jgi:hypothetical protein
VVVHHGVHQVMRLIGSRHFEQKRHFFKDMEKISVSDPDPHGFALILVGCSYGGLGRAKLQFFIIKIQFLLLYIFYSFWSLKPRIWIRIRIRIRIDLKCWIWIRNETNADPIHWRKLEIPRGKSIQISFQSRLNFFLFIVQAIPLVQFATVYGGEYSDRYTQRFSRYFRFIKI